MNKGEKGLRAKARPAHIYTYTIYLSSQVYEIYNWGWNDCYVGLTGGEVEGCEKGKE